MPDLAILHEHPSWFAPLFDALDRRGVDHLRLTPAGLAYDPASLAAPAPVILNRIAMSAGSRASESPIFFANSLLDHWRQSARVLNGEAFALDSSKARQLSLVAALGLQAPRTRVVHRREDVPAAAGEVGFPLVVKANIGGAGAGIIRYDDRASIDEAVAGDALPSSSDGVLLVQEFVPARDGRILRVETLGQRVLYALSIHSDGGFDLCPADACIATPERAAVKMEATTLDPEMAAAVERIAAAARLDVGGVELMIDDRDGSPRIFDINALSNFVARPMDVLGWDPHDRLVDYLIDRIAEARA